MATGLKRTSRTATLLALAASTALLAGCSLLEGPTPETPPRGTAVAPEVAPEFIPGGTAEENLPYFAHVLRSYGEGTGAVRGQPIVDAVVAAGFDPALMQVSFDQTKTNLVADNIFVSVRVDASCLIGQVVSEDRSTFAVVEPAVGPNGDICLIGNTAPIAP